MRLLKYFLTFLVCTSVYSQSVYELTPGTKNNEFGLSFSNSTAGIVQALNITVQDSPEWIEFSSNETIIDKIKETKKPTAQFYFNISDNAPVGKEGKVRFGITDQTGRKWFKSYTVKVTIPKILEVQQNYPNPFNPSTKIKYSIPQDAFVSIKVFNVLGEKITDLINTEMKAGLHEVVFNAANFSSGFYFYVVEARGIDGTKYFDTKKMILLK